jgi:hypothetical protein
MTIKIFMTPDMWFKQITDMHIYMDTIELNNQWLIKVENGALIIKPIVRPTREELLKGLDEAINNITIKDEHYD